MDCTITSTDKTRCQGMTLVEIMIGAGIGSLTGAAILALAIVVLASG